jgi:hypothetical protein
VSAVGKREDAADAMHPEVRIRDAAGRQAREEAIMLDRLVETLRLASFRSYLAATVVSMSSLVPDILALVGSDTPSALQRIRPGHTWPAVTGMEDQYGRTGPRTNRRVKVAGLLVKRPAPLIGDAVLAEGALGDYVEAKIFGGSLDVALRGDCFELSTQDGTGYVRYAGKLPDTVVAAAVGRPLLDVVDHPVLRSRGFVIEHAAQVGGASAFTFQVGRLDLEMPWRP